MCVSARLFVQECAEPCRACLPLLSYPSYFHRSEWLVRRFYTPMSILRILRPQHEHSRACRCVTLLPLLLLLLRLVVLALCCLFVRAIEFPCTMLSTISTRSHNGNKQNELSRFHLIL